MATGDVQAEVSSEVTFSRTDDGFVEQRSSDDPAMGQVLDPAEWGLFRKTALTRAVRVPRPFTVETSEGPLKCHDGYLAVDARGYPYPIAAEEFAMIYESVAGGTPGGFQGRVAELIADIREAQAAGEGDARNLAIAITVLEDAQMRIGRAGVA